MAQRERALVALSDTLGGLANNQMNREHERIMAMRQENFMRLQHMLGEESRVLDRAARKEELATEGQMRRDLFKEETTARREMFQEESAARRSEGQADRASRERIAGAEIGAQQKRWEREDIRNYDQQYLSRTNAIDKRIQELNDYKVQARAEGKLVDDSYLTQMDQELSQLTEQKRSLAQERDLMLARGGDSRYRKLSKEEVAGLKKPSQGSGPEGSGEGMPMAAQGPREPATGGSSIKVPPPPPKPQGMVDREERKNRPPAQPWERPQQLGELELSMTNIAPAREQPPEKPGRAWQGARDVAQAGRDIIGARDRKLGDFESRKAAVSALKVMQSGNMPQDQLVERMRGLDRETLTEIGFTERDLKKLGL